jgi:hypothetical protein
VNQLGMTPEQVAEQVNYGKMLPELTNNYSKLLNDIHGSEIKLLILNSMLASSNHKLLVSKHWLDYYNHEYVQKSKQLTGVASEINAKKNFTKQFDNEAGYNRIKSAAADQANLLLHDLRLQIIVIISATIDAISKYPANEGLISDILALREQPESYQNLWIQGHWTEQLRLAEHVHDKIIKDMVDVAIGMAISSTNFIQPDAAATNLGFK